MPFDPARVQELFDASGIPPVTGDEDAGGLFARTLDELARIEAEYGNRFGHPPCPSLAEQIDADEQRFRVLFQALASPMTTAIRTMVFCLLDGASLGPVRFEYVPHQRSHLEASVEYTDGRSSMFASDDLFDAEVLRHFGMFKLDKRPVLDGYYPL